MAAAGIAVPAGPPPGGPPTASIDIKRALLATAWSAGGPDLLVRIGQGIHDVASDPTLDVLRAANDPDDLLQRWFRLEKYHHSHHRTRLLDSGAFSCRLRHVALGRTPPSPMEDLVVLGLLVALLQSIGCRGLDVDLSARGRGVAIMRADRFVAVSAAGLRTAEWTFRWTELARHDRAVLPGPAAQDLVERLYALLDRDPMRSWPLAEAARAIGGSARSLQRRLRERGATYSGILRDARVRRASHALLSTSVGLAEIGYTSGFSDQAHFSREFRRIVGASPAEWRRLSAGRPAALRNPGPA